MAVFSTRKEVNSVFSKGRVEQSLGAERTFRQGMGLRRFGTTTEMSASITHQDLTAPPLYSLFEWLNDLFEMLNSIRRRISEGFKGQGE